MNEVFERVLKGLEQVGGVVPGLIGSALILLAGYIVARQVQRATDAVLMRLGFDRLAREGGLEEAIERTGSSLDPVRAVGRLLFWLVMLVVMLLASAALGLEAVNDIFTTMLGYIPTLIIAIAIIILGMLVGEFVRALVLASAGGVAGVPTLAKLAKGTVVLIALFMALQQLGMDTDIVTAAFTLILGAVALAVGLAFGLGNTQLAGEITRRWYEEGRRKRAARQAAVAPAAEGEASPAGSAEGPLTD
ncbi:MAG: hypothetical protein NW201_02960 [Gemmatimonadales bacterium]|nr:hypothetical protein [Gemmatimonadales bacterium]